MVGNLEFAILLMVGLVIMALTSETPQLRTRRLALIGIIVLLGLMMRLFHVQF